LKPTRWSLVRTAHSFVAFTPKGGCPLKPEETNRLLRSSYESSIHPQGWVPIETNTRGLYTGR